jgi:hypothetical protein
MSFQNRRKIRMIQTKLKWKKAMKTWMKSREKRNLSLRISRNQKKKLKRIKKRG